MKDFIIEEATKIFYKCLTGLEKTDSEKDVHTVSLLIRKETKNQNDELIYSVCVDHIPVRNISFMNVLGVKIDFKGYSLLVPPKIKEIVQDFELEFGTVDIAVAIYKNEEEDGEIKLYVFANGQVKREFHLEDVIKI